jgi:SAM-dependent methyltransferase
MPSWRSQTGRPLSSDAWLEAHHQAKLGERLAFAQSLASYKPNRVLDLGCGTGLWLDLLDCVLPRDCEIIGIDSDEHALAVARERSTRWQRASHFEVRDLDTDRRDLPAADLTLAFNLLSYLREPDMLLTELAESERHQRAVIRQYDGATLRFGPLPPYLRSLIDSSLAASLLRSQEFHYYMLDDLTPMLEGSSFQRRDVDFELFARYGPFSQAFLPYFYATLDWFTSILSDTAREQLLEWIDMWRQGDTRGFYFFEVDLVAVLSS